MPDIYIYGVTTAAPNTSTYISVNGASVNGRLHLNCANVVANGVFSGGVAASGTTNCLVNGVPY